MWWDLNPSKWLWRAWSLWYLKIEEISCDPEKTPLIGNKIRWFLNFKLPGLQNFDNLFCINYLLYGILLWLPTQKIQANILGMFKLELPSIGRSLMLLLETFCFVQRSSLHTFLGVASSDWQLHHEDLDLLHRSFALWHMHLILALRRQWKVDLCAFEASLVCILGSRSVRTT